MDNKPVSKKYFSVICALVTLAVAVASCGGKQATTPSTDSNYGVRSAVTDALSRDAQLRAGEQAMIQSVKAGQTQMNPGLDSLVDNNKSLMALIKSVSAPSRPPSAYLARARDLMTEYLRNRVHQLEASLVATTPQDLETMYARGAHEADAERAQVTALLLKYDPGLKSVIPQQ